MLEGLILIIVLFAAAQFYALQIERKRAIDRERELLAAILAKNGEEYLKAVEVLRRSSRDKLNELKLENELALKAAELEEKESARQGIPIR